MMSAAVQNSLLSNPIFVNAFLASTISIDIDSTLSPVSSARSLGIEVANSNTDSIPILFSFVRSIGRMLGKSSRWRSVIAWDSRILLTTGEILFHKYNLESSLWGGSGTGELYDSSWRINYSFSGPHGVKFKDSLPAFYSRTSSGKYALDVPEIVRKKIRS